MSRGLLALRGVAGIALAAWGGLLVARGGFWRQPIDDAKRTIDAPAPRVHAVVPARNESDVLAQTLPSLLAQQYPGSFAVTLVDDHSEDGTAETARALDTQSRLRVVTADSLPPGWKGKMWALACGIRAVREAGETPDYWLFTDADIHHDHDTVLRSVSRAVSERRDLVSYMVRLRASSPWERLLIPAFVFFFQKLYPFAWSNDERRTTAAAAGGCVTISEAALRRIGGIETLRDALIDDCTLAAHVKRSGGRIWLGLTERIESLRGYETLESIWAMVARSAFTQLDRSWVNLAGTVAGMLVLYVVPPAAAAIGAVKRDVFLAAFGSTAWLLMTLAYTPTLRLYRRPAFTGVTLPLSAALYTAMTIDSARRSITGGHGAWKGRSYDAA